ncbi:MAG: DUF983 domain-containing protein, partial [Pseudomonadota bacterium]
MAREIVLFIVMCRMPSPGPAARYIASTQFCDYDRCIPEHRDGVKNKFLLLGNFLKMQMPPSFPELSPFETGFRGKCPRCGSGDLYDGFLSVKPSCAACGLDYSFADAGDGPAFFVMSFASLFAVGFVLWMEFS